MLINGFHYGFVGSISVFAEEGKVDEVQQGNHIFVVVNDELVEFPDVLPK